MFHLTRRLWPLLPAFWLLLGLVGQPLLIPLPAALMLGFLVWRYRRLLALIGSAPYASDAFAKHVLVDDLLRLAGHVGLSPLIYIVACNLQSAWA